MRSPRSLHSNLQADASLAYVRLPSLAGQRRRSSLERAVQRQRLTLKARTLSIHDDGVTALSQLLLRLSFSALARSFPEQPPGGAPNVRPAMIQVRQKKRRRVEGVFMGNSSPIWPNGRCLVVFETRLPGHGPWRCRSSANSVSRHAHDTDAGDLASASKPNRRLVASPRGNISFTR